MRARLIRGVFLIVTLVLPAALAAQAPDAPALTEDGLEKLKVVANNSGTKMTLPPQVRRALSLPDIRMDARQLAAGGIGEEKYYFIMRTDKGVDDLFLSVQRPESTTIYHTNSKLKLLNAALANRNERFEKIPGCFKPASGAGGMTCVTGDQVTEGFAELLRVWAQVAESAQ